MPYVEKTADAYYALFKYISKNLFDLAPAEITTDYEEGMRVAIKKYWPKARIRGCVFHYKRAIQRKCKKLGMTKLFKRNKMARKVKRMLCELPFLPENSIMEGYLHIKNIAKKNKVSKRLENLFSYFEGYWLKQASSNFLLTNIAVLMIQTARQPIN